MNIKLYGQTVSLARRLSTKTTVATIVWISALYSFNAFSNNNAPKSEAKTAEIVQAIDETAHIDKIAPQNVLHEREVAEVKSINNAFSILQHKTNYILPITHVSNPSSPTNNDLNPKNVDNLEAAYQISVKMPLYTNRSNANGVFFAFTANSFWQVYNSEVSKPFRETNYEPEIFYSYHLNSKMLPDESSLLHLGVSHQSNGQSGYNSRSWNRIYVQSIISKGNYFGALKIWHRLAEDDKESPNDSNGDDNPDILDYMGNFELFFGTKINNYTLYAKVRNNLDFNDNKGGYELSFTYEISERYSLLFQYFNGYGDSLIDYNVHQKRYGLGIQLNFL